MDDLFTFSISLNSKYPYYSFTGTLIIISSAKRLEFAIVLSVLI